jgi:hypothetical protein
MELSWVSVWKLESWTSLLRIGIIGCGSRVYDDVLERNYGPRVSTDLQGIVTSVLESQRFSKLLYGLGDDEKFGELVEPLVRE